GGDAIFLERLAAALARRGHDVHVAHCADAFETVRAERAVAESLRLYPPTWLYVRVAQRPDVLPSGAELAAGAVLYLSPWVLHRDPELWPVPERCAPSRFDPEAAQGRPRHAYFPFGSGPRVCLGETLARLELGIAVP